MILLLGGKSSPQKDGSFEMLPLIFFGNMKFGVEQGGKPYYSCRVPKGGVFKGGVTGEP